MEYRRAYFLLLAGELIWLSLLIGTPYLAAHKYVLSSEFLYHIFSHFCHQRPERSFFIFGEQIPVCARDFSLYVAAFISTIVYPKIRQLYTPVLPSKWYLVVFLFPMAVDGLTQLVGLRESTNFLRFITGFLGGLVAPFYFIPLMMASSSIEIEDCQSSYGEDIDEVAQRTSHKGYERKNDLYSEE
jgi:uncharacterized membrane protein